MRPASPNTRVGVCGETSAFRPMSFAPALGLRKPAPPLDGGRRSRQACFPPRRRSPPGGAGPTRRRGQALF